MNTVIEKDDDISIILDSTCSHPLHQCVYNDIIFGIQFWIKQGISPDVLDEKGNTPLFSSYSKKCMKILLHAGADINHKNNKGNTVLYNLVQWQSYEKEKLIKFQKNQKIRKMMKVMKINLI